MSNEKRERGEENARLDAGKKVNGGGKGFQLSGSELLDSEMESLCSTFLSFVNVYTSKKRGMGKS